MFSDVTVAASTMWRAQCKVSSTPRNVGCIWTEGDLAPVVWKRIERYYVRYRAVDTSSHAQGIPLFYLTVVFCVMMQYGQTEQEGRMFLRIIDNDLLDYTLS
jgi:hypothetical protein